MKDYPRPQFVRRSWENLNGAWDFRFDDENAGEREKWYADFGEGLTIQVPFTYETKCSGIQDESLHDRVWYHKRICVDISELEKNSCLLHFEGCYCRVRRKLFCLVLRQD